MEARRKRKPLSQLISSESNTACPAKKSKTDTAESEKRPGYIESIVLKNFMCHANLEVQFNSNINVIVGQNGSGKSAILTALIVGLGGKASLTNRGTSVKGFVKVGSNSGNVEITLNNNGPTSYKKNVYGKSITIVRNFTASGSSSYRIKAASGQVISTQAKEIKNIATSFNIQIDNPICILNQDTSRNFLSSNDPKHKFTLFLKATKLETLSETYNAISANRHSVIKVLNDKKEKLKVLRNEMTKCKAQIDQSKNIVNLRERSGVLGVELLWAKARDRENELEKQERVLKELQDKHDDIQESVTQGTSKIGNLEKAIRQLEQQVAELKNTIEVQNRPLLDAQKTLDELKRSQDVKNREKQSIHSVIKRKLQDVKVLEREIANSNQNTTKIEQEKLKRIKNLAAMEDKLKGTDALLETARNDLFQLKSSVSRIQEEERSLQTEIHDVDRNIHQNNEKLRALQGDSGNTLLLYGQKMPQVVRMIQENKNRFKQLPRGPLGSYIKLKEKKWAVAVEGFLGVGLLSAFAVDNKDDNNALMAIFNKVYGSDRKPTIITSKFIFKKHDVRKYLVQSPQDCCSMYNAIEVEDPVVANCLVDQNSIEGILLVDNDERAMELMSNRARVPQNCQQAITLKGDRYYPDPNYKTYGSRYHRAQFLQIDSADYMAQLKQTVNELKDRKQAIVDQQLALRRDIASQDEKKSNLEKRISTLVRLKTTVRQELDELRDTAEPEIANIDTLANELTEVKNEVNAKTATLQNLDTEIKELTKNIEEQESNIAQLSKSSRNLEKRLHPLQSEIKENNLKVREINIKKQYSDEKMNNLVKKMDIEKMAMEALQQKVEAKRNNASKLGERPEELRTVQVIMDELNEVEKAIRRIENYAGNIGEVSERYALVRDKYQQALHLIENLELGVNQLIEADEKRQKHYSHTEAYFITYIKHAFTKILETRNFKGNIEVDMKQKKLELIVIPQQGSQGLTTTANLSGGERSFSTIAFLYSLWQCMDFPFYFLDEFDVYMDKLNRSKVFDILIHYALSRPKLQFVFLTPHDVSFLNKSDINVLRLEPPKRD